YISLTRGEGGQNLISEEIGMPLGMIRSRELMAARKVDGAEQTFGSCDDFGYSKSSDETMRHWNKEEGLRDLVWAIRKYRPDIIINRFPTNKDAGHGHHSASALLAIEAFRLAADPKSFPEQLAFVNTWQAKRIFQNTFSNRNLPDSAYAGQLKIDVGLFNPLLGKSYGEISANSRSMHKSQGFGVMSQRGKMIEYFKKIDGDTAVNDVFAKIPTGWERVPGGSRIKSAIDKIIKDFDVRNPSRSVDQLVKLLPLIRNCSDPYWKSVKEQELLEIIKACSGLWFEVSTNKHKALPGDTMGITIAAVSRTIPGIILKNVRYNGLDTVFSKSMSTNETLMAKSVITISPSSSFNSPYFLDHSLRKQLPQLGIAWNEDPLQAVFIFELFGEQLVYQTPFTYKWVDPVKGECHRPIEIVPLVSVAANAPVAISNKGADTQVKFDIITEKDSIDGYVKPLPPSGWSCIPDSIPFKTLDKGKPLSVSFTLTPPSPADRVITSDIQIHNSMKAYAVVNGKEYRHTVKNIQHDHIPAVVYLEEASVRLVATSFESNSKRIGYIAGAGDEVAQCLSLAGFQVDMLDGKTILNGSLSNYDAIITGIRAYNTIEEIGTWQSTLMQYVENGGTLVVQYNTNNFLGGVKSPMGPYPFKITRDRVTEEDAEPTFNIPNHPLLNHPNQITKSDFDHWVQERGLYFAGETSPEYSKPISWNDRDEKPLDGSIIYAKKGKGQFIYTGISFFRQLPAGVPGAYRLMVNMMND
ncbi:MAG: PIG-L family deacetylase, partial [Bacteroidota bacterium]